ncbi:MAG: hypothetical protein ACM3JB_28310 [Acidobacteriaceae bacterium]
MRISAEERLTDGNNMERSKSLDTHHKALSINLEASIFGSFAEIGAGQEVARWFLQVGGASATVAKTISAYDKEVSDEIYGSGSRYVSVERLRAMLNSEWEQLLLQVQQTRGGEKRFFSLVDTVAARNYAGTNIPHGWMGLRFQDQPGSPANDVLVHFNLMDATNVQQQEAVGILGVNLLYAAFHERSEPEAFLRGLAQLVAPERLEIDCIETRGPLFESEWNPGALHVLLVANRFTDAVICTVNQRFLPLVDALHKKAVVLAPGIFDRPSPYHSEMMENALHTLQREQPISASSPLGAFCLTVPPVANGEPGTDLPGILDKMQALYQLGSGVLLVHEREIYKMSSIVQRFTAMPIRFVVGISVLLRVFEDDYRHLAGSTLKAVALLFSQNVRIYAYHMRTAAVREWLIKLKATGWEWADDHGNVVADSLKPPGPLRFLYEYLLASRFIVPVNPEREESAAASAVPLQSGKAL